jgi:hypothetical protein
VLSGVGPTVIVDLDGRRQAEVPGSSFDVGGDVRALFVPEVRYRSAMAAGLHSLLRLHDGVLSREPYEGFDWQPSIEPAAKGRRRDTARADGVVYAPLRKAALALVPAKRGSGASRLYGRPHLQHAADWPRHAGRPMLLLCQLDLAALPAPAPLAAEGALLAFVAADEAGEPLLDELFHPAAWRVSWVPALAAGALPLPAGAAEPPPAQPLKAAPDATVWPQPDAAIVQALGWAPAALEAYRRFVDAVLPDGPKPGHRLGGYPTVLQHNDLERDAALVRADDGPVARWRLLLQLDSDDTFMWGTDSGTLYFMVHDDDLARRDLSRVVALTQGA